MIKLNPPFSILKIGLLRNIELYSYDESLSKKNEYSYLLKADRVKAVFGSGTSLIAVGLVDYSQTILVDENQNMPGVYIDSVLDNEKLLKIADSLEGFYKAILLVKNVWEGKEHVVSLEKSPENLLLRDQMLEQIQNENPNSETLFWNHHAFRELDIKLY